MPCVDIIYVEDRLSSNIFLITYTESIIQLYNWTDKLVNKVFNFWYVWSFQMIFCSCYVTLSKISVRDDSRPTNTMLRQSRKSEFLKYALWNNVLLFRWRVNKIKFHTSVSHASRMLSALCIRVKSEWNLLGIQRSAVWRLGEHL